MAATPGCRDDTHDQCTELSGQRDAAHEQFRILLKQGDAGDEERKFTCEWITLYRRANMADGREEPCTFHSQVSPQSEQSHCGLKKG